MSNNKQSSVEWAMEQMHIATKEFISGLSDMPFYVRRDRILQQAKAMHKEEIEEAYFRGYTDNMNDEGDFEQYYNETFGGNDEN